MARKHKSQLSSRSKREMRAAFPRTKRQFDSFLDARHAFYIAKTERLTRRQAAKAEGIKESTLEKWTYGSWKKRGSEYYADPSKQISPLIVQTTKGARRVIIRNSREATEVSHHYNAIKKSLSTGDTRELAKYRRRKNPTTGELYETDIAKLRQRDEEGSLNSQTIYWFGRRR